MPEDDGEYIKGMKLKNEKCLIYRQPNHVNLHSRDECRIAFEKQKKQNMPY